MKNKNQLESGRSMVEMLGVLAVIGVLSVGGIAGYKYAMKKIFKNDMLSLYTQIHAAVNASLINEKSSLHCCTLPTPGSAYNNCSSDSGNWQADQYDEICSYLDSKYCHTKSDFSAHGNYGFHINHRSDSDASRYLYWSYMTYDRPSAGKSFYNINMTFKDQEVCTEVYNSILSSPALTENLEGVASYRSQDYGYYDPYNIPESAKKPCSPWHNVPYYSFSMFYNLDSLIYCLQEEE